MEDIAVKLVASPLLIWAASLVGRRWGQSVAGWLVGLPLTSGPVAFFLEVDYGADFATRAAIGSLTGIVAQAAFCLAYAGAARRAGWPWALVAGAVAFAVGGLLCDFADPPLLVLLPLVVISLSAALCLIPRAGAEAGALLSPPNRDIPARMLVVTALVLGLTGIAPLIGRDLAGLLAAFPLFAAVLAIFAHRVEGEAASRRVLRGLLIGLFGFAAFFLVLALALRSVGIAPVFTCATLAALLVESGSLRLIRRGETSLRPRWRRR